LTIIAVPTDRLRQKHELFIKLGMLFGPLHRLIGQPANFNDREKAETVARYSAEWRDLASQFREFSIGQPGCSYEIEYQIFFNALNGVIQRLMNGATLGKVLPDQYAKALSSIDAIPVSETSEILEAGSPFKAYCKLRELCESNATKSLIWIDPYFDASVFHRYLSSIRGNVPVILVTSEPSESSSKRDKNRWDAFLDVSSLYAQENGPDKFRLIIQPNLHDRWVVFDDKLIYALGGSAKDAAARDYFTITIVDATAKNLERIQRHIETGEERRL
jgi:hypothetical protein